MSLLEEIQVAAIDGSSDLETSLRKSAFLTAPHRECRSRVGIPVAFTLALFVVVVLASGCAGTKCSYAPNEHMVVLQSWNHWLEIGPCGVPWNYDDQVNILMPADLYRYDASQLEAYHDGKLKIDSGYVILDRTNKMLSVDLTFEGNGDTGHVPVKCKYNGVHTYIEREPEPGEVTRKWLQDYFRTNGTTLYER